MTRVVSTSLFFPKTKPPPPHTKIPTNEQHQIISVMPSGVLCFFFVFSPETRLAVVPVRNSLRVSHSRSAAGVASERERTPRARHTNNAVGTFPPLVSNRLGPRCTMHAHRVNHSLSSIPDPPRCFLGQISALKRMTHNLPQGLTGSHRCACSHSLALLKCKAAALQFSKMQV